MTAEYTQLNARIPRVIALGAKRLARHRNIPVNQLVEELIIRELQLESDVLLGNLDHEERLAAEENTALRILLGGQQ